MSARTQMIRKLDGGQKPHQRDSIKGDYMKWARGLQARLSSLFDWERYVRHATHSRDVIRSINRDRAARGEL